MPERELQLGSVIESWNGVDQRLQPTRVRDGYFSFSDGAFFGFGENVERLPGKKLKFKIADPILMIFPIGANVLIQTLTSLQICPKTDIAS